MSLPETSRQAIEAAIQEFDSTLRASSEWAAWDQTRSQRYAISFGGRRYPPKKIVSIATSVPVSEFSGGAETNRFLTDRGFEIEEIQRYEIREALERLLREYPTASSTEPFNGRSPIARTFEDLQSRFQSLEEVALHPAIKVRWSAGKGNWAGVPWIAFLHEQETTTTQRGLYVVLLFRNDGSGVYLTLNQGVTELKNSLGDAAGRAELLARARRYRDALRQSNWDEFDFKANELIDLRIAGGLGRDYEVSTIAYKFYGRGQVPEDDEIAGDLNFILNVYERCLDMSPRIEHSVDPVHLLLKWSSNRLINTIEAHKSLADRFGHVWWGKFGQPLGQERIAQLLAQVQRGTRTYAFLVGGDTVWRTVVLDITRDADKVDDATRPDYYSKAECGSFLKLSHFEPVTKAWLVDNAIVDRGQDVAGSVEDILASRSGFGYVRLRASEREPDQQPTQQPAVVELNLRQCVVEFSRALEKAGLSFGSDHEELIQAFVASIATKGFVILTGLSGSGKTQLALKFGEWLGDDSKRVVSVRPDWTGSDALFGYEDALKPASDDGRAAWAVPTALQFMLHAAANPHRPFLLILDEMNLAHVERYFADALSGFESLQPCIPNLDREEDGHWRARKTAASFIPFPQNLWIVGTVNVDETTYMFSPKVLDRANTFEFRTRSADLLSPARKPEACIPGPQRLVQGLAAIGGDKNWHILKPATFEAELEQRLRSLHDLLARYGLEFGHRSFYEAIRFASMAEQCGMAGMHSVLDRIVLQKIMPKLHGSRRKLELPLLALARYCGDLPASVEPDSELSKLKVEIRATPALLPRSFDKTIRMLAGLRTNQFASFAE